MNKKVAYWSVGVIIFIGLIFMINSNNNGYPIDEAQTPENTQPIPTPSNVPNIPRTTTVNFQTYNIDYMNDNVKRILVSQLGSVGKSAFYLPSTGYINVSRGAKYGVAFAIQNVNPKVPDGNEFVYDFSVNVDSLEDCGVSESETQDWIESGWHSEGMISGQWREDWNEWYDAMTIRFDFPSDIEPCNIKYDFVLTRDGAAYDSKTLEFNLI